MWGGWVEKELIFKNFSSVNNFPLGWILSAFQPRATYQGCVIDTVPVEEAHPFSDQGLPAGGKPSTVPAYTVYSIQCARFSGSGYFMLSLAVNTFTGLIKHA